MKKISVRILILGIVICSLLAIGSGTSVLAERTIDEWAHQIVSVQPAGDEDPAATSPVVGAQQQVMSVQPAEDEDPAATSLAVGAQLVVANQTVGGDGKFEFRSATLGAFWLTTNDGIASTTFNGLAPGIYDVVEGVPPDWRLAGASCSDGSDLSRVELASGETVVCTFTNVKEGTIVVNKETVDDTGTFNFGGDLGAFDLTTAAGIASTEFSGLAPGTYDIEELAGPLGLTGISCLDPTFDSSVSTSAANVNLAAGETVECTFRNGADESLMAMAVELADEEDSAFDFGSIPAAASPPVPDRSTAVASAGFDVDPDPGDPEALPDRDDGEDPISIACDADLIIRKASEHCCSGTFTFNTSSIMTDPDYHTPLPDTFDLNTNSEESFHDLAPGIYTITELVLPDWKLTDLTCEKVDDDNKDENSTWTITGSAVP